MKAKWTCRKWEPADWSRGESGRRGVDKQPNQNGAENHRRVSRMPFCGIENESGLFGSSLDFTWEDDGHHSEVSGSFHASTLAAQQGNASATKEKRTPLETDTWSVCVNVSFLWCGSWHSTAEAKISSCRSCIAILSQVSAFRRCHGLADRLFVLSTQLE